MMKYREFDPFFKRFLMFILSRLKNGVRRLSSSYLQKLLRRLFKLSFHTDQTMLRKAFSGLWGKPRTLHSLEQLKYLHSVLSKNQTVTDGNKGLLVETIRSIAEILIWGDQNDSSVFDFFLERNMLSFFLKFMDQKTGNNYVCVQLLQTLNILFENIRNETSIYYLLSNNHVNSIIVHKFDFSDEEVNIS